MKIYNKILAICILFVVFTACGKRICCTNKETNVYISYQDSTGNDLINSSPEFGEENIRIYYKNGDVFEYQYNEDMDSPGQFSLTRGSEDRLVMTVFLSDYYDGDQSTTLIELNENVVDTIVGIFDLGENSEVLQRVWLNGQEMEEKYFEIVK